MEASLVLICQLGEVGKWAESRATQMWPFNRKQYMGEMKQSGEDVNRQLSAFPSSEKSKAKATLVHGHMYSFMQTWGMFYYCYQLT